MLLNFNKILFLLFILIFHSVSIFGAGMGGQGNPCGGPFNDPCPVPLDGGIGVLLAAGVVYGGRKIYLAIKKA